MSLIEIFDFKIWDKFRNIGDNSKTRRETFETVSYDKPILNLKQYLFGCFAKNEVNLDLLD